MQPGDVIDGRFEITRSVASGGMGAVFLAHDRERDEPVAIKLALRQNAEDDARFAREARLLTELRHPAIVRYVASGVRPDTGQLWLAMEWLEGEDLQARLRRGPLPVGAAVRLAIRVADALACAHASGIVHRDLKPANLFLAGHDVDRVAVLDFGVARAATTLQAATATGVMIGTAGYMAPEQVRGERVGPAADVFSLGAVLFECLTGSAAFRGAHLMAVLAQVFLDDPPRATDVRADVPRSLADLVARMMAKDPAERPADAAALAAELRSLAETELPDVVMVPSPARAPVGHDEQRVVAAMLVRTNERTAPDVSATASATGGHAYVDLVRGLARGLAAHVELLPDGTIVVVARGEGPATDQSSRMARCALAAHALRPDATIAVATLRARTGVGRGLGAVLDGAAALLSTVERRAGVLLTEDAAALVEARFEVVRDGSRIRLVAEREAAEPARRVAGRATPFVGRERELTSLLAAFESCVEEQAPRVTLVTGDAGMGKTRLGHELVRAIGSRAPDAFVLIGRADPITAGGSLSLLASAIRGAARIGTGQDPDTSREHLAALVGRHVADVDRARIVELLGELIGLPQSDAPSALLRAARANPSRLAGHLKNAVLDWLDAECSAHPVVIVVEDLHWGDDASVQILDAALGRLVERPLMILALARPAVRTAFPDLWAGRGMTQLDLSALSRRASEKVVRAVLGADAAASLVARISAHAAGNAFYLEELVRAAAEGAGGDLPESVIAMAQARIEALDAEARRCLRAASVFGIAFSEDGVRALVGDDSNVAATLERLESREVVVRSARDASDGDRDWHFRHALLRDAAYAMLTTADRAAAHRHAAEWLARAAPPDAFVIATHLDAAGERKAAVRWYIDATAHALRTGDLAATIELAERAVACGAEGIPRGLVRLLQSDGHFWRDETRQALDCALEAAALIPADRPEHWTSSGYAAIRHFRLGETKLAMVIVARIVDRLRAHDALVARFARLPALARYLLGIGALDDAEEIMALLAAVPGLDRSDDDFRAQVHWTNANIHDAMGRPDRAIVEWNAAIACYGAIGALHEEILLRNAAGAIEAKLGLLEKAEQSVRETMEAATRLKLPMALRVAQLTVAYIAWVRGDLEGAREQYERADVDDAEEGNLDEVMSVRYSLSRVLVEMGDLDAAERCCRRLAALPPVRWAIPLMVELVTAQIALRRGNLPEAMDRAATARQALAGRALPEADVQILWTHARCLHAVGRIDEARVAIGEARDLVLERARAIDDEEWRASYLERGLDNARVLAQAREWLA